MCMGILRCSKEELVEITQLWTVSNIKQLKNIS